MAEDPLLLLIKNIWDHVSDDKKFFVVVEAADHFFIESPDDIEQVDTGEGDVKEAGVMIFTTADAANYYREYLIEERDLQPSSLTVSAMPLSKFFSMLPKINKYTEKKYGAPTRIQAVHYSLDKEYAFSEILHSKYVLRH